MTGAQRLWSNTAYWLAASSLLSMLSYITQDHLPRSSGGPGLCKMLTVGCAFPHQSLTKKMPTDLTRNLMEASSQLTSFSEDHSLCQVDKYEAQCISVCLVSRFAKDPTATWLCVLCCLNRILGLLSKS